MKPTSPLCARLRLTTKNAGKGFYRGNRTGSLGAHTSKGGYLIDYRKVRAFTVPDLKDFQLTPFVTKEIGRKERPTQSTYADEYSMDPVSYYFRSQDNDLLRRERAMKYLQDWKLANPDEVESYEKAHFPDLDNDIALARDGEKVEVLERLKSAIHQSRRAESAPFESKE